jgi:hypothetical protein
MICHEEHISSENSKVYSRSPVNGFVGASDSTNDCRCQKVLRTPPEDTSERCWDPPEEEWAEIDFTRRRDRQDLSHGQNEKSRIYQNHERNEISLSSGVQRISSSAAIRGDTSNAVSVSEPTGTGGSALAGADAEDATGKPEPMSLFSLTHSVGCSGH